MTWFLLTWLMRWGHVLSAAVWTGAWAVLALAVVPRLAVERGDSFLRLAITCVRVGSYAGTLTMGFGLVLVTRTRGYDLLFGSTWGLLVVASFVLAVVILGVGDGGLRPALRRAAAGGDASPAQRIAYLGLALTALAIGLMTAAVHVGG